MSFSSIDALLPHTTNELGYFFDKEVRVASWEAIHDVNAYL